MGVDIPASHASRIAERRRAVGGRAPGGHRRARDVARAVPAAPVSVWPEDVRQRGGCRRRRAGEPHLDGSLRPRLPRRLLSLQLALHHRAPVLHQEAAPKQVRSCARRVAGHARNRRCPAPRRSEAEPGADSDQSGTRDRSHARHRRTGTLSARGAGAARRRRVIGARSGQDPGHERRGRQEPAAPGEGRHP